ncbi:MAG: 2-C-methyl-D-erythritol 2,4-cyclodiphosphate synthase [Clostridia bacterium]|nr:2-C-methyl-D-erythritol 2,4-cyclodiphosphate synthase [Clostridia bacterium]
MKTTAIITAAGKGSRAKLNKNKLLEKIGGKTVLELALLPFDYNERIDEIIVTASKDDYAEYKKILTCVTNTPTRIVTGGETRTFSVLNALNECDGDIVIIHDGARPFVTEELINRCLDSVLTFGSGVACVSSVDTVGVIDGDFITQTHRNDCCNVQTPQAFLLSEITEAYSRVTEMDSFTDDAGVYAKFVKPAHMVEGEKSNVKLTFREDFEKYPDLYCGTGFDLHRLIEGRKLVLGGVLIPHDKGLLGHSDADCVIHSLMDALLSAAGLKDIGNLFPDTDLGFKDADSAVLLASVVSTLKEINLSVKNVSLVIMAEKPRLAKYTDAMKARLAPILGVSESDVGISCTTLEGIGTVGREEGIAAQAYVLLQKSRNLGARL